MDVFKTQPCRKANCRRLNCTYYHDESDQRSIINYKAQYCIAYEVRSLHSLPLMRRGLIWQRLSRDQRPYTPLQETGQCPYGTECHFAHDSSELLNVDTSANFITRKIESEDTESMLSTETAESSDVRSMAR